MKRPNVAQAAHLDVRAEVEKAIVAERLRVATILQSDEAQGREQLATKLVIQGMDAQSARSILADVPRTNPYFEAAMSREVGAVTLGTPGEIGGDAKAQRLAEIEALGARKRAERAKQHGRPEVV
jgi:5-keto 4-deoxyuronate isomerase